MPGWFDDWVLKHATRFGLLNDPEMSAIASWEPVFDAAGYLPDELAEATDFLASHPGVMANSNARYVGKLTLHLNEICRRIKDRRAVSYRLEVNIHEQERGTCNLCGGSGRVVVPHPGGIKDGEWVAIKRARAGPSYYTFAVFCRCPLGEWTFQRTKVPEGMRVFRLEEYERDNPRWKVQMAKHQRELRENARLTEGTADEQFLLSWRDLMERTGVREPGVDNE